MDIKNKVAVVTGAGGGIGRQTAIDLSKEGCDLLLCEQNEKTLAETKALCADTVKCVTLPVDLSDMRSIDEIIQSVKSEFGRIDILINCAGVLFQDGISGVTEEMWDLTMNVNLKAQFFLDQKALEIMAKNEDGGYIINFASNVTVGVPPNITSYGVSKHGVVGISQAIYQEAKKYGIRVTTIYPGMTDSPMLRNAGTGTTPDEWMQPSDISELLLYLLKSSNRIVIRDILPWSVKHDFV